MGLLQNISLKYAEPLDRTGDTSEMWPSQLNWGMNKYINIAGISQKSGVPDGYSPPYSFLMAIKEGGMSSFLQIIGNGLVVDTSYMATVKTFPLPEGGAITGSGTVSSLSSLSSLLWILSNLSGSGEVDDSSGLISYTFLNAPLLGSGEIDDSSKFVGLVWLLSSLIGSGQIDDSLMSIITTMASEITATGTVSAASITLFLNMISNITGSGEIDSTTLLKALTIISSTINGSGQIDDSPLKLFAWCLSSLTGTGTLTGTMKGWADMGAILKSYGDLTAEGARDAILNAIASQFNNSSTIGEQINNAGTGGNPWDTIIESGITAEEAIKILLAIAAGKTTITDLGGGNATVKFRDINDTADRVTATMDDSERTNIVINTD